MAKAFPRLSQDASATSPQLFIEFDSTWDDLFMKSGAVWACVQRHVTVSLGLEGLVKRPLQDVREQSHCW